MAELVTAYGDDLIWEHHQQHRPLRTPSRIWRGIDSVKVLHAPLRSPCWPLCWFEDERLQTSFVMFRLLEYPTIPSDHSFIFVFVGRLWKCEMNHMKLFICITRTWSMNSSDRRPRMSFLAEMHCFGLGVSSSRTHHWSVLKQHAWCSCEKRCAAAWGHSPVFPPRVY